MSTNSNQVHKYQLIQIESSTPEELVVLAYDALLKILYTGKTYMAEGEIEKTHESLKKAQLLIFELISALKTDVWDGAIDLLRLYEFMLSEIRRSNIEKS